MVNLISEKFLKLVEQHSGEIMKLWIERMKSDPLTSTFLAENMSYVENKAHSMLRNIIYWVSNDISKEEFGRYCHNEGMDLFTREIPLCEVIRAMYTGRRTILRFVESMTVFETAMHINQVRELDERITLFFDRAVYHISRGYNEEMRSRLIELAILSRENPAGVFFDESFYS